MSAADHIAALNSRSAIPARVFTGNDPAVEAWNRRQGALAAIEAFSSFYGASDGQIDLLASYEDVLDDRTPAQSLQGVLAKLWVALSHSGPVIRHEQQRSESDAVRRADTADVATFIKQWDCAPQVLFSAICDLQRLCGENE